MWTRGVPRAFVGAVLDWIGTIDAGVRGWRPESRNAACPRCARSLTPAGCPACGRGARPPADAAARLGPYADPLRGWILELKRTPAAAERGRRLGRLLGRRVRHLLRRLERDGGDSADAPIVVPVPMAPWRRFRAGIDHARVLAEGVAAATGGHVAPLLRRRGGRRQAGRSRSARRRGASRGLGLVGAPPASFGARTVILVDDVLTTGATARAAVRRLRRWKPRRIVLAVVCVSAEGAPRPKNCPHSLPAR